MTTTVIVVVVLVVLVVLGLALAAQRKRAGAVRAERERAEEAARLEQARDHRRHAEEVQLEADRQAGEAQAQAARARQEQLAAERRLEEAEQRRTEASGLHAKADELDPDRRATAHVDRGVDPQGTYDVRHETSTERLAPYPSDDVDRDGVDRADVHRDSDRRRGVVDGSERVDDRR